MKIDLSQIPKNKGRTTAQAHFMIAEALTNPNIQIKVEDHYGTRESNLNLLETIIGVVEKMEYFGFTFDYRNCSFKFSFEAEELGAD